jgi:hypothetical protein
MHLPATKCSQCEGAELEDTGQEEFDDRYRYKQGFHHHLRICSKCDYTWFDVFEYSHRVPSTFNYEQGMAKGAKSW